MKLRKRRLKYITVLPAFVTLMNGACGFIAILFASRDRELRWNFFFRGGFDVSYFTLAGYMIILAMIADMLDGRLARLTRTTSSFGGQLDSLTDVISFGVAPAFLMLKLVEPYLESLEFESFKFSTLVERSIFFAVIIYVMCAVMRLARFNVENAEDESAQMNFAGLPSPAAAGVVVSFVILHEYLLPKTGDGSPEVFDSLGTITIAVLPLVTLFVSILMVSRIRYPHLTNQLLRGKKTLPALLTIFASGLLIVWNIHFAMVFGFCGFVLFGFFRWVIAGLLKKLPSRYKSAPPSQSRVN
jgi:CDP-diacylglycerol--serine O-phosphatidyltransferase